MKRRYLVLGLLSTIAFSSCVKKKKEEAGSPRDAYEITATVGMIADVTREIAGDRATVTNIIGEGIDPHSFQAGPSDIEKLSSADLILYNGLHLEGKLGSILEKQAKNKPVIAVAEGLLDSDYEIIGGAEESDPHIWMDVSGWNQVSNEIMKHLLEFDPANAKAYQENFQTYQKQLIDLDHYAHQCFATIPESQRVLVTAHDAFSYLGRAYGLDVRGIQGISTESKAGLNDINQLVDFLVEKKIPAVFVESSVPERSVKALIEGAAARGHQVVIGGELFSDAMGPAGTYEGTYIGMIDHNITTIVKALGGAAPDKGLNGKLSH